MKEVPNMIVVILDGKCEVVIAEMWDLNLEIWMSGKEIWGRDKVKCRKEKLAESYWFFLEVPNYQLWLFKWDGIYDFATLRINT